MPSRPVSNRNSSGRMISLKNVSFRYGDSDVLRELSLDFADGSLTAIMGANGSGKSTLARLLNGLLMPSSGNIVVDGLDTLQAEALPMIRRKVGLVFQDPGAQMTSATIERELAFGLQNIGLPIEEIRERVATQLQQLNLTERRTSSPALLAGGEKQRLALAAVMMLGPSHLVLDEPTSFLSPASRKDILERLVRLNRERRTTIILITQFLSEAMQAERLVILGDGGIALDISPQAARAAFRRLQSLGVFVPKERVAADEI